RSVDGGASWNPTTPPVFGGISAGFTKGSTIVSRGRLFQRGNLSFDQVNLPKRTPFGLGAFVRALAWLPGGKLCGVVARAPPALYVTLDSARTWLPRPAIGMPLDTLRQLAAATVSGRPDVLYAAAAGQGLWRSLDAGVHWGRLPSAGSSALA